MSTGAAKICKFRQVINLLVSGLGTAIICSGCSANGLQSTSDQWQTYRNPRYGFEFPYPSSWDSLASPDNNDGIAIVSPKNQNTEIRAWVSKERPDLQNQGTLQPTNHNFQTIQGISGVMVVETGQKISSMKMTITSQQVQYHWQAQTTKKDFPDHYRLFYYIAKEYKIEKLEAETRKRSEIFGQ